MNERVGAAAAINRHFQDGETTCHHLSKRLPDNSTIFAAEATSITLALNYYQHMGPVHQDEVVYFDAMSCLQAIEVEDTEKPFLCHFMNLLWLLNDKGTLVRLCWIPSHSGIEGNERVDQLAKQTLDQDTDPLANIHYTDLKPLGNSYIQKLVQTKWDVAVHGRDLYLVKPTSGPPKKYQHLTRAEKVVITRLRIDHTKATKFFNLSRITVKHWASTICSWSVEFYRNARNTTQFTGGNHAKLPSSRWRRSYRRRAPSNRRHPVKLPSSVIWDEFAYRRLAANLSGIIVQKREQIRVCRFGARCTMPPCFSVVNLREIGGRKEARAGKNFSKRAAASAPSWRR